MFPNNTTVDQARAIDHINCLIISRSRCLVWSDQQECHHYTTVRNEAPSHGHLRLTVEYHLPGPDHAEVDPYSNTALSRTVYTWKGHAAVLVTQSSSKLRSDMVAEGETFKRSEPNFLKLSRVCPKMSAGNTCVWERVIPGSLLEEIFTSGGDVKQG
ncbi:hypothetical protein Bbelb_137060 [Branchiostoma belcheri]|nr:hypothetical protein Bbelb_137060 [Branchiostoma belcheri]